MSVVMKIVLIIFNISLFQLLVDGWFMVFNATFHNISVISWRSVLLVDETGENHRPVASNRQTLSHNVASSAHRH